MIKVHLYNSLLWSKSDDLLQIKAAFNDVSPCTPMRCYVSKLINQKEKGTGILKSSFFFPLLISTFYTPLSFKPVYISSNPPFWIHSPGQLVPLNQTTPCRSFISLQKEKAQRL